MGHYATMFHMGIRTWLKSISKSEQDPEKRASVDDERYWGDFFAKLGFGTPSGEHVTPENSLQVSTVFACVRVLAESIASLPLTVYKRQADGGKLPDPDHYLHDLLKFSPNSFQTSYEFFEMMMGFESLRGNSYAFKVHDKSARVIELIPLVASRMNVSRKNKKTIYTYITEDSKQIEIPEFNIWHWKGISLDGVTGLSPIALARNSVGLAKSAEKYGSKFFANDAQPAGILKTPGKLDKDAAAKLKEDWQSAHSRENAFRVAVMHGGLDWEPMGMSNEDSQFLDTRSFQVEDIARIFRVPSLLINHPDKTATYASAEQFFLSFVVYTIRPHLVRIEQSILKNIFSEEDRKRGYFAEFNINALLRGDVKSRNEAYALGRSWGYLSANDIRKMENRNPIENGDIYLQPMNMVEAGTPPPDINDTGSNDSNNNKGDKDDVK